MSALCVPCVCVCVCVCVFACVPWAKHPPAGAHRNERLVQMGMKMPISLKTGTTIAGIIFKDGVILGADTRATEGSIVADKNCSKIHHIAPNI